MEPIRYRSRRELIEHRLLGYFQTLNDNRLPSEDDLANMLGVSRTTVRAAMNGLVQKGYLNKRGKKGNFCLNSVIQTRARLDLFSDFPRLIEENGMHPALRRTYLRTEPADAGTAQKLDLASGEQVHHFLWNYLGDDDPVIVIRFIVSARMLPESLPIAGQPERNCMQTSSIATVTRIFRTTSPKS